jgi:hypothetical protein
MAYVYQVGFHIHPEQMSDLQIGASLERVLGYLRALLPNDPGFITVRVVHSLDQADRTDVVCFSEWERWEDLDRHRRSTLAEDKVLVEFGPHVGRQDLVVRIYGEVA